MTGLLGVTIPSVPQKDEQKYCPIRPQLFQTVTGQFQKFKDIAKMCSSDVKPLFYMAELKQKRHQLVPA